MRVAIFASAFYPSLGGVEELVRQLAHRYRRMGISSVVLTERWPRSLAAFEEYEGIPTYRLPFRAPDGDWKAHLSYHLRNRRTYLQMLTILRERKVDLLHLQCVSSDGLYALRAKRALKLPLVVTAQGELTMDASQVYARSRFINVVLRDLLTQADHITACSRNTLDDVETFFGRPLGARASVITNGVRLDDFRSIAPYTAARPYILGIGRLVPQKGFDILLRAFAAANPESHDLVIAGDGAERTELERLTAILGLKGRVQFFGRADRTQAVALFRGASFFVLPSRQEPLGIVNLEAMAAGKAVLASRVGGVPEIVRDEETGVLVPGGNVKALAAALRRLTSDEKLRDRLGAAGYAHVGRFEWAVIAEQYAQIYRRLLAATASPAGSGMIGAA